MQTFRTRRLVLAVALAPFVFLGAPHPAVLALDARQAPQADTIGQAVANYVRISPGVATGGRLAEGAVSRLKASGFRTIVDLRGPAEGVGSERLSAEAAGLRYVNIPVTPGGPSDSQVAEFARVVDHPGAEPILVHCVTGIRAGAMWTLYRVSKGVPVAKAVEEGRAIGMRGAYATAVLNRLQQAADPR